MQASDPRAPLAILVPLAFVALLLWLAGLAPGHPWGDDWAAYLMQAQALRAGTADAELATNTLAMQRSDVQVGPYAYPWGFPLMLAAVSFAAGWSLTALKSIGVLAIALLIWATYRLTQPRIASPAIALCVTALATLQPFLVVEISYLGSDVPFAALSTLALALILAQYRRLAAGEAASGALMVAIALLSAAAFAVRSNGAVLPGTYLAMLALVALRRRRIELPLLRHAALFGALTAILFAFYLSVLPDGSLVHASYVAFDPALWLRRLGDHLNGLWSWFPFTLFPSYSKALPLLLLVALIVRGALRWPWESAILGIYGAAHLALLTIVPFQGGARYYMPLLAPAFVLFGQGWQDLWNRWREARAGAPRDAALTSEPLAPVAASSNLVAPRGSASLLRWLGCATLVALLAGLTLAQQRQYRQPAPDAPYGPAMQAALGWIEENLGPEARIAFSKARAFRLLSGGRLAFVVSQPERLALVDCYVYNALAEPRLQVPESALTAPNSGFRRAFAQGPIRIYVREHSSRTQGLASATRLRPERSS